MMRDFMRHVMAAILMAGTLAATVWTFSAGLLRLPGSGEMVVSVGGIAFALEGVVILAGLKLSELDHRIQAARRSGVAEQYKAQRKEVFIWFCVVISLSAIANYVYCSTFDSWFIASLRAVAPPVLIYVTTVVLRTTPRDHDEVARQHRTRIMVSLQESAGKALQALVIRMVNGDTDPALVDKARVAAGVLRLSASSGEQQALDYFIDTASANDAQTVDGSISEQWYKAQDVAEMYAIPLRTAQDRMKKTPGYRVVGRSGQVPATQFVRKHGLPPQATPQPRQMALPDVVDSSLALAAHDGPSAFSDGFSASSARNDASVAQVARKTLV